VHRQRVAQLYVVIPVCSCDIAQACISTSPQARASTLRLRQLSGDVVSWHLRELVTTQAACLRRTSRKLCSVISGLIRAHWNIYSVGCTGPQDGPNIQKQNKVRVFSGINNQVKILIGVWIRGACLSATTDAWYSRNTDSFTLDF
jgi:hypothetical protein